MKRFLFCVVASLMIVPGTAHALTCLQECTFNYQFQFTDGSQFLNLSGQLTTSNTPVSFPPGGATGYDILSITGTISGINNASIDTLLSAPDFDNVLYFPKATITNGGTGYFDQSGIFFGDKNGAFYAIFDLGEGDKLLFGTEAGVEELRLVTESISPVPEPSTWALLLIGFAALGVMVHRRQGRAVHRLV